MIKMSMFNMLVAYLVANLAMSLVFVIMEMVLLVVKQLPVRVSVKFY